MLVGHVMAYAVGFLLMVLSISASGSVFMFECLLYWCCKYVSAVTMWALCVICFMLYIFHLLSVELCRTCCGGYGCQCQ